MTDRSTEPARLPTFGAVFAALSRVFDPTRSSGHELWLSGCLAQNLASEICPAQRSEICAATLLRQVGFLGDGDRRGTSQLSLFAVSEEAPNPLSGASSHWTALAGLAEIERFVRSLELLAGRDRRDPDIPVGVRVVRFADLATAGAWALREAGAFTREALLDFVGVGAGRDLDAGVAEAFDAALGPALTAAFEAGEVPTALVGALSDSLQVLSSPFSDSIGRLFTVVGTVADEWTEAPVSSAEMARRALVLAQAAGANRGEATLIKWAATVHHVGELLAKIEWSKEEPAPSSARLAAALFDLEGLDSLQRIFGSRAERWDGTGDRGLAGLAIPFGARVLAVVEAQADSMAPRHLEELSGKQLDPALVDAARRVLGRQP